MPYHLPAMSRVLVTNQLDCVYIEKWTFYHMGTAENPLEIVYTVILVYDLIARLSVTLAP